VNLGVVIARTRKEPPVTLTESDLSELLDALKAGELTERVPTSLEWILEQLMKPRPRPGSALAATSAPKGAPPSATDCGPGCCRRSSP
jgi:integrase